MGEEPRLFRAVLQRAFEGGCDDSFRTRSAGDFIDHDGGERSGAQAAWPQPGGGNTPDRPELLRQIESYEALEQNAERTHAGTESMVKIYTNLAVLYEDLGMLAKSEDVTKRDIARAAERPAEQAGGCDRPPGDVAHRNGRAERGERRTSWRRCGFARERWGSGWDCSEFERPGRCLRQTASI